MNDSTDSDRQGAPRGGAGSGGADSHPLERAHRLLLKAAPVIRDVSDTIDRHGGLEQVRDKVVERAGDVLRHVDEVVSKATAIEGEVLERDDPPPVAPRTERSAVSRPPARWVALGVVTAAATYGALRLQRRR